MSEFIATKFGCTDPNIVWNDTPIVVWGIDPDGNAYAWGEWNYGDNWFNRSVGFGPAFSWYAYEPTLASPVTGYEQYWVKVDLIEEVAGDDGNMEVEFTYPWDGVWFDYWGDGGYQSVELFTTTTNSRQHLVVDITVAPDDGAGNPKPTCGVTKRVTYVCEGDSNDWVLEDTFASNGELDGKSASGNNPTGETWTQVVGEIIVTTDAQVTSGPALYVYETNESNFTLVAQLQISSVADQAIIGRYVDSNNYWEARIKNPGASGGDPSLELNKIVAGVSTTVDSVDLHDEPNMNGDRIDIRLTFYGDIIEAAIDLPAIPTRSGWTGGYGEMKIVGDDSAHNTATKVGYWCGGTSTTAEIQRFAVDTKDATYRNSYHPEFGERVI